ncbi:hypothetical protein PENSPDRAFT_649385 [Peniophora sp. CONT]|nr:hypothetical protein PENSPDRAFT_649385 [Peniophora sp. CONT]
MDIEKERIGECHPNIPSLILPAEVTRTARPKALHTAHDVYPHVYYRRAIRSFPAITPLAVVASQLPSSPTTILRAI